MDSNEIEEEFNESQTLISDLKNDSNEISNESSELEEISNESSEIEEISNDVEESKEEKTIYLEIVEDSNFWRTALMVVMLYSGGLIFYKFFPIEFLTPETLWRKYVSNCCHYIYNKTRCAFSGNCSDFLLEWIQRANKTANITDVCCYWFAPYSKWRILSEAFCEIKCLK